MSEPSHPLPTGTVTFLFTDVEGSTRLLQEHGDAYADLLAEHRRLIREACTRHGGVEVDTQGDAFFVAFPRAAAAAAAALAAQQALAPGEIRVRMGLHTGEPVVTDEGYVGMDVHRAARIAASAHGGQMVVSETTRGLLDEAATARDLGEHRLKDLTSAERLFQLGEGDFPPLRTLDTTNLPVVSIPLVGREQELEELVASLSNGTRLITVTGPGGTGKTRLALQVAAELVGTFSDGVFWVPLAGLTDPELLASEVAQTVGAPDDLMGFLRGRELLLLLDNFEHLLDAAPVVSSILAPPTGFEPSSRAGRPCASGESASTGSSRSRRSRRPRSSPPGPGPSGATSAPTTRPWRRSAAGSTGCRSRSSSPRRGRNCSHPTGCSSGSTRLSPSSPAAPATRPSASGRCARRSNGATTCSTRAPASSSPASPSSRARSRSRRPRRSAARSSTILPRSSTTASSNRSVTTGSSCSRRSASTPWSSCGREARRRSCAGVTPPSSRRSRKRRTGIASAPRSSGLRGSTEITTTCGPRSTGCWAPIPIARSSWRARSAGSGSRAGSWAKGCGRLQTALAASGATGRARARALTSYGALVARSGDAAPGIAELDAGVAMWRELGDLDELASALDSLGWPLVYDADDNERSLESFEQALELRRQLGDEAGATRALVGIGQVLVAMGETERAEAISLDLLDRAADDPRTVHFAYHYLADCALIRGDPEEAGARYRESLRAALPLGDVVETGAEVQGVAMSEAGRGNARLAVVLAASVEGHWESLGLSLSIAFWDALLERYLAPARALLGEELEDARAEGRTLAFDNAVALALRDAEPM